MCCAGKRCRPSGGGGSSGLQAANLQVPSSSLARVTTPYPPMQLPPKQVYAALCFPPPPPAGLTAGGGAEAQGASPSITQQEEPQILRSLSAPVMLKGKRAMAVVQSRSSLLTAVLAQDSPSDESVVCSAPSTDRGWGQGRAAVESDKFTAKSSLGKLY